jgi:hypothetical protein
MADRGVRIELGESPTVLLSADFGQSWTALGPNEARALAAKLCVVAERVDERETERERQAA